MKKNVLLLHLLSSTYPNRFFWILMIFLLINSEALLAQTFGWSKYVGTETQSASASDGLGNVYVLASFKGSISYGSYSFSSLGSSSRSDLTLVKYDKDGNVQWARRIGSTGDEYVGDVAISKYGSYLFITGSFSNTVSFGTYHGYTSSPLTSRGGTDVFVARYDAVSGTLVWARQAGGTLSDNGNGIFTDVWGDDVYITGSFTGTSYFKTGTSLSSYGGTTDAFFAKYDRNGNFTFAKRWGGAGYDYGKSIAVDKYYDNIYITGGDSPYSSPYIVNFFLAKFNSSGNYVWSRSAGGNSYIDSGHDLVLNSSGHYIYIIGTFSTEEFNLSGTVLSSNGSADAFVAKYYENGNLLWAKNIGGYGWDEGQSIAEDLGNLYISGTFSGAVNFGHTSLTSYGSYDIFLSHITTGGDFRWTTQIGTSYTDYGRGNITIAKYNLLYFSGHRGVVYFRGIPFFPSGSYVWKITPPSIPYITEFRLINADTDVDVKKIYALEEIKYSTLGTRNINIKANTSPSTVGSVVFKLDSNPKKTENNKPYAYAGDQPKPGGGIDYKAFTPSAGSHKLEATPYSGPNGTGVKGTTTILYFSIKDDLAASRTMAVDYKIYSESNSQWGELQLQAHPNPFADYTTLEFIATMDGTAHLALYDLIGAMIQEVFHGEVKAGQRYEFAVDGSALKSSLYISKLTLAKQTAHQKLLLAR